MKTINGLLEGISIVTSTTNTQKIEVNLFSLTFYKKRYSAGIVEWTKADLDVTDRKTRKLMTMHGMLHPRSNVSRLYLPRSEGGRGLLSVSDSVNIERWSLQCHVRSTQEKLLKVAQKYMKAGELGPKEYNNQRREERTRDWQ